jgi:farnesyl-diphosphate farnesyltransferase
MARTTDTIADTEIVPAEQRLDALQRLRGRILGNSSDALRFDDLALRQGLPAERGLLEKIETNLSVLRRLPAEDLAFVRQVLDTIISGQELDLRRFDGASVRRIVVLQTDAELDDYTYRVAGCVGEFWTRMCRTHLFPEAKLDEAQFLVDAVRFGKGLQLVNILRDLPVDLRKGRCYLPAEQLSQNGLEAPDLLHTTTQTRFKPMYERYLDLAKGHLIAGWNYTNTIPCAWPILIGTETLQRLRDGNVLEASQRIKVNRADVRRIMVQTIVCYPLKNHWRKLGPAPVD